MTTYELETGTIGFREIPNDGNIFNTGITANNPIPEGFELLGIFSQLKEEDVKEVMPTKRNGRSVLYEDFNKSSLDHCAYALESIHSLAQHLGLNAVNLYGEKPTFSYEFPEDGPSDSVLVSAIDDFDFKSIQWQQAQSKVKQYFVVFKAKQ